MKDVFHGIAHDTHRFAPIRPATMRAWARTIGISDSQRAIHRPASTRTMKNAEIVRVPGGFRPAREVLSAGRADVYGENVHVAYRIAAEVPGATVLEGRFNLVQ